jgi:hypothetical protein
MWQICANWNNLKIVHINLKPVLTLIGVYRRVTYNIYTNDSVQFYIFFHFVV